MSDPNIADVSLLLLGNGSNGGAVVDSSPDARTVTASGGCVLSTAQSKWGTSSIAFDGTDDYLTVPHHADMQPPVGSADWTLEAWIRPNNIDNVKSIFEAYADDELSGCRLHLNYDYIAFRAGLTTGNINIGNNLDGAYIAPNTWYHIAVVKNGTTWTLYVNGSTANGTGGSTVSQTSANNYAPITRDVRVGRNWQPNADQTYYFNGHINDLRVTAGVARYTADFTPPAAQFDGYSAGSSAALTMPSPSVSAFFGGVCSTALPTPGLLAGEVPTPTVSTASAQSLSYGGINSSASSGRMRATSSGHDSTGENDFTYTATTPTLTAFGGANAEIIAPRVTLASTATSVGLAKAALTAPSATLVAGGTVSGTASAALKLPFPSLIGYSGAVCSVTLTGSPTVVATGTGGGVGTVNITAPLFELTASATVRGLNSASLIAPSARLGAQAQAWIIAPSATLTAIGTAVVAVSYEAYAVNLNHQARPGQEAQVDEMTRYTNYPFDRIVRYKNSYFGMNSTGLYLLEGTTDNGTAISYEVKTCMTDFDSPQKKTIEMAYFGARFGAATISLHVGESGTESYSYTTPRGAAAQNYRQAFGRGIKSRYYALSVAGSDTFSLDTLTLNIAELARKV